MARINMNLAEGVAREALKEQRKHKESQLTARVAIVCASVLLVIGMICGTIIAVTTIREQQYALNMQYASLMDLLSGAEVTTTEEIIDGSDGGIAAKIEGDNNSIGDKDGETE